MRIPIFSGVHLRITCAKGPMRVVGVIVLSVLLSSQLIVPAVASATTTSFSDGFESGTASAWSGTNKIGTNSSVTITATAANNGNFGLDTVKLGSNDNGRAEVYKAVAPTSSSSISLRTGLRIISRTGTGGVYLQRLYRTGPIYQPVAAIVHNGTAYALLVRQLNGSLQQAILHTQFATGVWYDVELVYSWSGAQPNAQVYVNGSLDSTVMDATAGTLYQPDSAYVGLFEYAWTQHIEAQWDDASVADGVQSVAAVSSPSPTTTATAAPTANSTPVSNTATPTLAPTVSTPLPTPTATPTSSPSGTSNTGFPSDPLFHLSPATWFSNGTGPLQANNVRGGSTYVQTNVGGYGIQRFTGTTFTLLFDNSVLGTTPASQFPIVEYSIDGASWTSTQLSGTGSQVLTLSSTLGDTAHDVIWGVKYYDATPNRWSPVNVVRVTGYQLQAGRMLQAPVIYAKTAVAYGDSITEALHADDGYTGDLFDGYAWHLRSVLQAEVGVIGFNGQGWTTPGTATLTFPNSWAYYWNGTSRLIGGRLSVGNGSTVGDPTYVINVEGTNDALGGTLGSSVTSNASSTLAAERAAAPTSRLVLVVPFGRFELGPLSAATLPDSNSKFIDLGQELANGLSNSSSGNGTGPYAGGTASRRAIDGLHPGKEGSAEAAQRLGTAIVGAFGP